MQDGLVYTSIQDEIGRNKNSSYCNSFDGFSFYVYLKARQLERNIQEIHQYEQLRNALEEAERIRNKDIELLMGAVKIETQIVETIHTEIVHSECDNLGNDWLQFYNDAIEKSNSFSVSD